MLDINVRYPGGDGQHACTHLYNHHTSNIQPFSWNIRDESYLYIHRYRPISPASFKLHLYYTVNSEGQISY